MAIALIEGKIDGCIKYTWGLQIGFFILFNSIFGDGGLSPSEIAEPCDGAAQKQFPLFFSLVRVYLCVCVCLSVCLSVYVSVCLCVSVYVYLFLPLLTLNKEEINAIYTQRKCMCECIYINYFFFFLFISVIIFASVESRSLSPTIPLSFIHLSSHLLSPIFACIFIYSRQVPQTLGQGNKKVERIIKVEISFFFFFSLFSCFVLFLGSIAIITSVTQVGTTPPSPLTSSHP